MPHAITVIGAGAALNSAFEKSCVILDRQIMIDAGSDPMPKMSRLGLGHEEISHLLLTHLHGDHFFGAAFLIAEGMISSNPNLSLLVIGPQGVKEAIVDLLKLAYPVTNPEVMLEKRGVRFQEVSPGELFLCGDWQISCLRQDHGRMEALAFRLKNTISQAVIGFTGDGCPPDDTVDELAGCTDLVINTPTISSPIPAHGTLDWYTERFPKTRLICIHRTFDADPRSQIAFPADGDTLTIE